MDRAMAGWMNGKVRSPPCRWGRRWTHWMRKLAKDPRYFEHWIERNLLDNPRRVVIRCTLMKRT
jgi:Zn-dependent M16 (insulinase) family peptidase